MNKTPKRILEAIKRYFKTAKGKAARRRYYLRHRAERLAWQKAYNERTRHP